MWRQWRSADREARLARRVTIVATALFVVVLCRWRPWDLFVNTGFSNNFYDEQARAFWHLRLQVPASVAGPEGFLIGGRTYLYYGPVLAVLRMPFVLFGHGVDGRLTRVSMVVAFAAACTATFHLGRNIAAAWPQRSHRRVPMLVLSVVVSPLLALAGWTSVYHETELWAFALFIGTIALLAAARTEPTTSCITWAAVGSVATVLTRASVGYGAIAAVAITGALLWRQRQPTVAVRALGIALGGFVLNVVVNLAKFGTLLDLPADKQVLTIQNPHRAAWFAGNGGSFFSARFVRTTLVQYLRPDGVRFERLVPFVRFGPLAHQFGSYPLEGNTPASSLTSSATLLLVAAVIGSVIVIRQRHWHVWPWMLGALLGAVPTFIIGFVANRYLTDLLPLLVIPAAFAFAAWQVQRAQLARGGFAALAVWGVWCNVALAVWTSELKNPGFTSLRYHLDDTVFGGSAPSVVSIIHGVTAPRDGVVGIDGACDGLYIAEQGNWVALERADGVRRAHGTFDSAAGTIFTSPTGTLELVATADGTLARWTPVDGTPVDGTPVRSGAPARLDIASDPVSGGLTVSIDGHASLYAFAAPPLGEVTWAGTFTPITTPDGGTAICRFLQGRH
jgi:hypothetical protein